MFQNHRHIFQTRSNMPVVFFQCTLYSQQILLKYRTLIRMAIPSICRLRTKLISVIPCNALNHSLLRSLVNVNVSSVSVCVWRLYIQYRVEDFRLDHGNTSLYIYVTVKSFLQWITKQNWSVNLRDLFNKTTSCTKQSQLEDHMCITRWQFFSNPVKDLSVFYFTIYKTTPSEYKSLSSLQAAVVYIFTA